MEVVAATFRRTSESRQVHSLSKGPGRIRPGPFLCTVALTESLHRLPAGDQQAIHV